ncbi:hypothetical protein LSAT2_032638 [Lamellibrachia satsuma]|nr:hypothetical protein LSAT2_032638 [Lamellibrachia satsuma]
MRTKWDWNWVDLQSSPARRLCVKRQTDFTSIIANTVWKPMQGSSCVMVPRMSVSGNRNFHTSGQADSNITDHQECYCLPQRPSTLTPTRANATQIIHRRNRSSPEVSTTVVAGGRALTVNVTRSTPIEAKISSIMAADKRSRTTGGRHKTFDADRGASSSKTYVVDMNECSRTPNENRSTSIKAKITPRNLALSR